MANAPYRVTNDCDEPIQVQQQGVAHRVAVGPRSSSDFLWHEPLGTRMMLVAVPNELGIAHEFLLDPDPPGEPVPHGAPVAVWTTVLLGQASRIVRITRSEPQDADLSAQLSFSIIGAVQALSGARKEGVELRPA